MRFRFFLSAPLTAACCSAILLTFTAPLAQAQWRPTWSRQQPTDCVPAAPSTVAQPGTTATPSIIPQEVAQAPSSAPEFGSPVGGETFAASAVGYIDSAIPLTQFRLRYDAAYHDNRPDRAEFFYAKCGCFATPAAGRFFDPKAAGPPKPETSVNYQDISSYLEIAFADRISGFVELPVRFLNPEINNNTKGLGDMNFGFKGALLRDCDQVLSFQFRAFMPTGDADRGLGNDHVSLEPALLYYRKLTERLTLESEFRVWVPIDGSDFEGNVLRYGVGLSYDVVRGCNYRIAPVVEVVGWTVLNGQEFSPVANGGRPYDAGGDTIVNLKAGVRADFGRANSVYLGYGQALTGEVWYKDVVRLEYRRSF